MQEQSHSFWREQWSRGELPKDYGGWGHFKERMQFPSNLVGQDSQRRKAGEFEFKQLETGCGGPLNEKEKAQLFSETSRGFSINPVPTHGLDLTERLFP